MEKFNQVCVWEGTTVGIGHEQEFVDWLKQVFGVRGKYLEEVETLPTPNQPNTGDRVDLFFSVHDDDLPNFAVPRLLYGIRWWEDVLGNGGGQLYDDTVLHRYPKTW